MLADRGELGGGEGCVDPGEHLGLGHSGGLGGAGGRVPAVGERQHGRDVEGLLAHPVLQQRPRLGAAAEPAEQLRLAQVMLAMAAARRLALADRADQHERGVVLAMEGMPAGQRLGGGGGGVGARGGIAEQRLEIGQRPARIAAPELGLEHLHPVARLAEAARRQQPVAQPELEIGGDRPADPGRQPLVDVLEGFDMALFHPAGALLLSGGRLVWQPRRAAAGSLAGQPDRHPDRGIEAAPDQAPIARSRRVERYPIGGNCPMVRISRPRV